MITLHDAYDQGSDDLKTAIRAFAACHPATEQAPPGTQPDPDWKTTEKHFTQLTETIMGTAAPERQGRTAIVRRAEQEALRLMLAFTQQTGFRCPVCVRRNGSPA